MKSYIFLFSLLLIPTLSFADLPLSIESLVADSKQWTFESGMIYGNMKTSSTQFSGSIPIDVGNHQYLALPTNIKTNQLQNEYLVGTLGARYGIRPDVDIGFSVSGSYLSRDNLSTHESFSTQSLSGVDLTGSYQFLSDDKYPAVVGFGSLGVVEHRNDTHTYFSNLSAGLTTYRSYDPVVLSLSMGYKHYLKKNKDGQASKPSDIVFINPQVAFAANERVSLLAGVTFRHIGTQRQGDIKSKSYNNSDVSFGLGYGLDSSANLNFMVALKQNFDNAHEFRVSYNKKFK